MTTQLPASTNVVWHHATVTRARREAQNGHRGAIIWFTGLSGEIKGTLPFLFFIFRLSWPTLWAILQLASHHFPQPPNKIRIAAGQPFFYIL
ncbi:MAG: hypothetical protein NUV75_09615, partial [Gallionella sp.]|nr:hypothetical protein [Gallionella sp.]